MSEKFDEIKKKGEKKEEFEQTQELKNMLNDLDDVPKLKSTATENFGVVSKPSFLKEEQASSTPFPEQGKLKLITKPTIAPKQITLKKSEDVPKKPHIVKSQEHFEEEPSGDYWKDTAIFFKQLGRSYEERYQLWNQTYSSILAILRKMRRINENNTKVLISSIDNLEIKLISGLKDFSMKRNEVERFSDIDYKLVTKNFKKTMGLLNLQIREFKLQQSINELFDIYAS